MALLLSATFALLWLYLSAPMGLRLFGLRCPLTINKRIEVLGGVGFPRFLLLYGVFTWGMAGFAFFVLNALLEWRFSVAWTLGFVPAPFNSPWRMLIMLVTWSAFGSLLAWSTWKRRPLDSTRPPSSV